MKMHECAILERKLAHTTQARGLQELLDAEKELKAHQESVTEKRARLGTMQTELRDLEYKLAHLQEFRAAQLKAREKEFHDAQKACDAAQKALADKKTVYFHSPSALLGSLNFTWRISPLENLASLHTT